MLIDVDINKLIQPLWTYHLVFEKICMVECGNCGCEGTVCAGADIARKSWNSRVRIIKNLGSSMYGLYNKSRNM